MIASLLIPLPILWLLPALAAPERVAGLVVRATGLYYVLSSQGKRMAVQLIERGNTRAWPITFAQSTPGAVGSWIVEAPWAHPMWSQYFVTFCHLRQLENAPPPIKFDRRATHEIVVAALDPSIHLTPEANSVIHGYLSSLRPLNFVGQWEAPSDEEAARKVEDAVRQIIRGELSPDSDFRALWEHLFPFSPPEPKTMTRH